MIVYVRHGINARRREELETHNPVPVVRNLTRKLYIILVGNIYRPPDSKVEFNDRFERYGDFIDFFIKEDKEFLLLGDFNKTVLNKFKPCSLGNNNSKL